MLNQLGASPPSWSPSVAARLAALKWLLLFGGIVYCGAGIYMCLRVS